MKTPESKMKSPASAIAKVIVWVPAPIPTAEAVNTVVNPSY
jgi:hypothetical protein